MSAMGLGLRFLPAAVALAAAVAWPAAAQQAAPVRVYEANWRERAGMLTCMKGETMYKSTCVKPCQDGFRLDLESKPPKCIATRADAKYVPPPPPQFQTPEKSAPRGRPEGG